MSQQDVRRYLHTMLTIAPIDFSIETNAKISKLLEYSLLLYYY